MDNYTHLGGNPDLIVRFIHSTRDPVVPLELTEAFHDAMVELDYDSVLWAIEGAGHNAPASPTLPAGEAVLDVIEELIALSGS